jgi:hypothetical protein
MKTVGAGIEEGSWNVLQANGNLTSFFVCLKCLVEGMLKCNRYGSWTDCSA